MYNEEKAYIQQNIQYKVEFQREIIPDFVPLFFLSGDECCIF